MLTLQKFRLMDWGWLAEPRPELVEIPAAADEFRIGELDAVFGERTTKSLAEQGYLSSQNFGYPPVAAKLTHPFAIGRTEVTYEQYDYYVWQIQHTAQAPSYPIGAPNDNGRGERAVVNVSWNDANGYLRWLSERSGAIFRLPTEVEWEYAARAGTTTAYWWGEDPGTGRANCRNCGSAWDGKLVAPVGSFEPNGGGLHDTAGNVWEWTCSEWQTRFDGSQARCADPAEQTGSRSVRGGSWYRETGWLRSSARYRGSPGTRGTTIGFRVLRAPRTH